MTQTTILLLDSLANRRTMLNVLLTAAGYRVVQTGSLAETLRLTARVSVDLVISALSLPDGRAEQIPGILHRNQPDRDVSVVGIAMQNDYSGRLRALGAGLDEVLMSPIEDRVLIARVRNLLKPAALPSVFGAAQGGFAEPSTAFAMAEPIARLAIVGTHPQITRPCYDALDDHPDLYLAPAIRELDTSRLPGVDCVLMQVASSKDLKTLQTVLAAPSRPRAGLIAVCHPDYYLHALEAGVDDAVAIPVSGRELLIRVRSQLRRRARAQGRMMAGQPRPAPFVTEHRHSA